MFRRFGKRWRRDAVTMVWVAVGVALASSAVAAPRVQVRGSSRVELRAVGSSPEVRVSGVLRDEVGTPIPNAAVVLSAVAGPDVALEWKLVKPCDSPAPSTASDLTAHPVQTDDYGAFCVQGELSRREATILAVFGGDGLHQGTRAEVRWDAGLLAVGLSFAPRPERVDLDAPHVVVFGRLSTPDGVSAAQREIMLTDERGDVLGAANTDETGAVHIDLASSKFAGPGIGQLRLRFAGSEELAAAEEVVSVVRSARVRLQVDGEDVRGDPARGVGFVVRAVTARGAADGGTVEVFWGSAAVGAARVSEGRAHVVATFVPSRDTVTTELTVRYSPDAPYYEAGPSIPVHLTVARSQLWMRALPALVALAVAGWLLRGWRRPRRRAVQPQHVREQIGEPSLNVVGAAKARATWSGAVVDAHDGAPIAGAAIKVIAPSFAEVDVIAEVRSSEGGRFEFHVASAERDLRLRVEAPFHAQIERPLPPASDMVVGMVSRRRALLERLVNWARRAGRPWDKVPEPTPGHVVRVASGQRHPRDDIGMWARRVEQRAYGPDAVDASAEREVVDIEPRGPAVR